MKKYNYLTRKIFSILILLTFMISLAVPVKADKLSSSELINLYNNTNWVPSECSSGLGGMAGGTGLSDGATFPNINPTDLGNGIKQWIQKYYPNSPFLQISDYFVQDGKASTVNPFLIVALAVNESGLGTTTIPSSWTHANNAFGRTATSTQPHLNTQNPDIDKWYLWNSAKDSIDPANKSMEGGGDMGSYLRNKFGDKIDSNNILSIAEAYANPDPAGAQEYVNKLNATVNQLIAYSTGRSSQNVTSQCQSVTYNCPNSSNSNNGSDSNSSLRQKVVCIAEGELAIWSSQPGYPWSGSPTNTYSLSGYLKYSQNSPEEWCADFASWVYKQAGSPLTGNSSAWRLAGVIRIASVGQNGDSFSYHTSASGYVPKPGDLSIYDFKHNGSYDHVDIVISVSGNNVTTIGGDVGTGPGTKYPGGSIVFKGVNSGYYSGGVKAYVSPN